MKKKQGKKQLALEAAYKKLKKQGASVEATYVPDRFGSYPEYYIKWNKANKAAVLSILEGLLEELK